MRRTSGVQPTFQRTSTRASRRLSSAGFRRGSTSVALHDASLASDRRSVRSCRRIVPTPRENRLSSDAPFEPLPAGPHERFGVPRPGAPFTAERLPEIPGSCPSASATNVKIEHTRERLVSPRTRRVSTDAAIEGQRAAKHRLPGWKSSSRFAGGSDRPSFGTRHERPARIGDGHLCRTARRPICPERHRPAARPKARLRPAARTVRPSNEPRCLHAVGNHGSSPWPFVDPSGVRRKRPFFTRATATP